MACILFFFSHLLAAAQLQGAGRPVLRASIVTGFIWLFAKYIFVAVLPHLDLKSLYGPFYVSVGLLFWAYISGLILFAGRAVQRGAAGMRRTSRSGHPERLDRNRIRPAAGGEHREERMQSRRSEQCGAHHRYVAGPGIDHE